MVALWSDNSTTGGWYANSTTTATNLTFTTSTNAANNYVWNTSAHRWSTGFAPTVPAETEADRRRRAEQRALWEREAEERRVAEAAAEARAEELLGQVLGPSEIVEFKRRGFVEVPSCRDRRRRYRIRPNKLVEVMEGDRQVDRLCVHSKDWVPSHDDAAIKLLLAAFDEDRLLKTAIRHGVGAV